MVRHPFVLAGSDGPASRARAVRHSLFLFRGCRRPAARGPLPVRFRAVPGLAPVFVAACCCAPPPPHPTPPFRLLCSAPPSLLGAPAGGSPPPPLPGGMPFPAGCLALVYPCCLCALWLAVCWRFLLPPPPPGSCFLGVGPCRSFSLVLLLLPCFLRAFGLGTCLVGFHFPPSARAGAPAPPAVAPGGLRCPASCSVVLWLGVACCVRRAVFCCAVLCCCAGALLCGALVCCAVGRLPLALATPFLLVSLGAPLLRAVLCGVSSCVVPSCVVVCCGVFLVALWCRDVLSLPSRLCTCEFAPPGAAPPPPRGLCVVPFAGLCCRGVLACSALCGAVSLLAVLCCLGWGVPCCVVPCPVVLRGWRGAALRFLVRLRPAACSVVLCCVVVRCAVRWGAASWCSVLCCPAVCCCGLLCAVWCPLALCGWLRAVLRCCLLLCVVLRHWAWCLVALCRAVLVVACCFVFVALPCAVLCLLVLCWAVSRCVVLCGAVLCCRALRRSLGCCVLVLCAVLSHCVLSWVALCRLVSVGVVRLAVCCAALLFAAVCCAAPLGVVSGCAVLCCPRCALLFRFGRAALCCAVLCLLVLC